MKDKNYNRLKQFKVDENNIDLTSPRVMGIVNTTPDSFYKVSRNQSDKELLTTVEKMFEEGADFIDVGGYSTRPNAPEVSIEEELHRINTPIELIIKQFPKAKISIDTFRSEVAKEAVERGAIIVNDVTGGNGDTKMFKTIASLNVTYILMHMRGNPATMQSLTHYSNLINDIKEYFNQKITTLNSLGVENIILDLGYGFSKTLEQNFELLKNQLEFKTLELPILTGISRKSMIYKHLNTTSENALNGTTALNMVALQNGASILRVHDVKEAVECVKLYEQLTK